MTMNEVHESTELLPEHAPRLDWAKFAPEAYKAMIRLDTAAGLGVEPTLLNLVKIRASQINRCAFCLDMHSKDALAAGESAERIIQLNAWTESKTLLHGEGDRSDRADRGDHRTHRRIRP